MYNKFHFFSEAIDFSLSNQKSTTTWLSTILKSYKKEVENINYIFCSDDYLLEINKTHLNHNYYTDIITFDLSETENLESDIFISIDRVKDNADKNNVSFEIELYRVMAHGLLHLIGFNDKTDEEKIIMKEKEDSSLSLLKIK